jgi:hypothetical protein
MNKRKYRGQKWWRQYGHWLWISWHRIARGLDPASGIVNMGEVRIDDMILNDPRMRKLADNPTARALYYEAYIWSDREASEGIIDDVVLPALCRGFEGDAITTAAALVEVGFWERKDGSHYIIGFMESGHATRAERMAKVKALKETRAKAGKKGADARWQKDGKSNGKSSSEMANGWQPTYSDADGAPLPADEAEF